MKIALIEDDALVQSSLRTMLKDHELRVYRDSGDFLSMVIEAPAGVPEFDLILLDLSSASDLSGDRSVGAIPLIRRRFPRAELVVQSGASDVGTMRACVRNGASRFVAKEHLGAEIPALIARLAEISLLRDGLDRQIIGHSPAVVALKRELLSLRFENVDVLLEGETGSGKEFCAQALHTDGPWLAVNASAIPSELFEAEFFGAERGSFTGAAQLRIGHLEKVGEGTLFLDEVQSLSLEHQAKLLRVLETRRFTRVGSSQERPFKARVVAASNGQLREAAQKGSFREDLYYRLATVTVIVPPLRVRGADIELLARHFLASCDPAGTKSFTPEALQFLTNDYDWPGNVRELRNLVKSLVLKARIPRIDAPEIREALSLSPNSAATAKGLSPEGSFQPDWSQGFDENVARFERYLLEETLKTHQGQAAREHLRLARSRYYEKLKNYGIKS